jgi:hypothetical protein
MFSTFEKEITINNVINFTCKVIAMHRLSLLLKGDQ